ncbi:hypothetical protein [Crossiella cryophila]|uniref:Serine kinase n=1 Tax=Crossiella cryophila TaxID=43355 RepID=A0A7W7CCW1_9PSEU|nr:hypothetical protein [Crossiella cryophila]MBB4678780.1 hypothetical protein [Crossiella cryophila]
MRGSPQVNQDGLQPELDRLFTAAAAGPPETHRVFRIGGFRCWVHSTLAGQHRALRLFVPWDTDARAHAPRGPEDWSVDTVIAPELLARLRELGEGSRGESLEIFAGETVVDHHRLAGPTELFVPQDSLRHVVLQRGRDVRIVLADGDRSLATYAVRAFREAFHRTQEEAGGLMMHAAACAGPDGAALIVGEKGAGKTTLLLSAGSLAGASYLANDRTVLRPGPEGHTLLAYPMVCRVHPGTAGVFPELAALATRPGRLARPQHPLFSTPHADFAEVLAAAGPGTKLEFAPAELTELLGIPLVDQAPLRCLIFAAIDRDRREVAAEPVGPAEAVAELLAQCFTPDEEKWITPWLLPRSRDADRMRRDAAAALRRVASDLPCYRLRYGHGAEAAARAGELVMSMISRSPALVGGGAPGVAGGSR